MAVTFFTKAAGAVAAFVDPTLPAFVSLKLEGWQGFQGFRAILTRNALQAQTNAQFSHTFGGDIYLYVFGDRIGELGISGLAFDQSCDSGGVTGIEHVMKYYQDNRVVARDSPVRITIGTSRTIPGYLIGFSADLVDPKTRIYQFTLRFAFAPDNKKRKQGGGGGGADAADSGSGDDSSSTASSGSGTKFPSASASRADGSPAAAAPVPSGNGWSAAGTGANTSLYVGHHPSIGPA